MDSKKSSLLAALTAKTPLTKEPDSLPNPSERIKRKSSALTEDSSRKAPSSSDKSFSLIMKDTTLSLDLAPVKKKPKMFEFKATSASTPPGTTSTAVGAKSAAIPFQMKERLVSEVQVEEKLNDLEVLQLSSVADKARLIRRLWRTKGVFDSNFVVVGVVCHMWKRKIPSAPPSTAMPLGKSATPSSTVSAQQPALSTPATSSTAIQTSQSSTSTEEVMIVRLSDLQRTSVSLSIKPSLQSKVSLAFGSVVLILNPVFLSALDGEGILMTIEKETQMCVVGISSDIGLCKYRQPRKKVDHYQTALKDAAKLKSAGTSEGGAAVVAKEFDKSERQQNNLPTADTPAHSADGESEGEAGDMSNSQAAKAEAVCPNFVNATVTEYCEYHMFELVRHTKSQRMVLNDAGGGALGSKAQKKESTLAAKHLSEGMFSLFDCKWRVSERGVKLVTHETNARSPSISQIDKMADACPRGGRNLRAAMLGVAPEDTPEAQLRLWKRDRSSVSTSSNGPPMHPNSLLPRSRPK